MVFSTISWYLAKSPCNSCKNRVVVVVVVVGGGGGGGGEGGGGGGEEGVHVEVW